MARVSLWLRIRTADGRHPFVKPAYSCKGRLKPLHALISGQIQHHPEGQYFLRYTVTGKRRWERLGADPFLALDSWRKREHELALGVVSDAAEPKKKNISQFRDEFLQRKRTTTKKDGTPLDPETITAYEQQTAEFISCVKGEPITGQDLRDYMTTLRKRGLSHRSICNHYSSISTFLKFAGVDHKALLPYHERPTPDDGIPEAYSEEEVKQFFSVLTEERDRIAFEFLLKVGTREREMTTLEFCDLTLGGEPTVTIRARKPHLDFRVKTGKSRTIPLEKSLAIKLAAWRDANLSKKLVFGTAGDKEDTHFYRVCVATAAKAGLTNFWLHKWRDTAATTWLRSGVDLRTVSHWLGHSSITMTEKYLCPQQGEWAQRMMNGAFVGVFV